MTKKQKSPSFHIQKEGYMYELFCKTKETIVGEEECETICASEKESCILWEKGTEFDQYYKKNKICPNCNMVPRSRGIMAIIFKLKREGSFEEKIPCCECYSENPKKYPFIEDQNSL